MFLCLDGSAVIKEQTVETEWPVSEQQTGRKGKGAGPASPRALSAKAAHSRAH